MGEPSRPSQIDNDYYSMLARSNTTRGYSNRTEVLFTGTADPGQSVNTDVNFEPDAARSVHRPPPVHSFSHAPPLEASHGANNFVWGNNGSTIDYQTIATPFPFLEHNPTLFPIGFEQFQNLAPAWGGGCPFLQPSQTNTASIPSPNTNLSYNTNIAAQPEVSLPDYIQGLQPDKSPYPCPVSGCRSDTQFQNISALKRHVETVHLFPDKYPCPREGCVKAFGRKDHLRDHRRRRDH
ncbi:hypothetical protein BDW59DRAFT_151933 [Aspergillus cavernicola]|uniref:C2H2-type domain-containing protein n=1 Tax=Aspergillus cavernicola TaxID=176166 RepID=A0ABR4HTC9_9EURO